MSLCELLASSDTVITTSFTLPVSEQPKVYLSNKVSLMEQLSVADCTAISLVIETDPDESRYITKLLPITTGLIASLTVTYA